MDQPVPESARATLREFADFVRRPRAIAPSGLRAPGAFRRWGVLTGVMIAVMVGLMLPLLHLWQTAFALPTPDVFGQLPTNVLIPVVILVAPVLEELLFRGWLSGRVRALWLLACALAFGGLLYGSVAGLSPLAAGASLLGLVLAAPIGWFVLRKRGTPRWFAAAFPAAFYLTTAIFSLVHIGNYPSFSALALPLILPQLWAGLVLGFVRMRIGLPASILAHMAANSASLAIALLLA